jgi:hypothetical protein
MSDDQPQPESPKPGPRQQPHRTAETERIAEAREAKLAAALRANLRRRKVQSRERDDAPPEPPKS